MKCQFGLVTNLWAKWGVDTAVVLLSLLPSPSQLGHICTGLSHRQLPGRNLDDSLRCRFRRAASDRPAVPPARSGAAPADGARPGRRLPARPACDVGADPGPVRSRVHRRHEPGHGALSRRLSHQERADLHGRRHRPRRHRGVPRLDRCAGREGAGADLRPLRPLEGRDREPARRRGRLGRDRVGHGVRGRPHRGSRQEAPAQGGGDLPGRHLGDHAAAAGGHRRDLPAPRCAALCRLHRIPCRQPVRDRCLAGRHRIERPAEVPVRPARHIADHVQRARASRSSSIASTSSRASRRRA